MGLASLVRMLRLTVARGKIQRTDHSAAPRSAQVRMLQGELADRVHVLGEYGSTSRPLEGAECIVVCVGGDRSHPVIIATHDRNHPGPELNPGDYAIFAAGGPIVICRKDGGLEISGDVTITGNVQVEGDVVASGDLEDAAGTVAEFRTIYNSHTHLADGTPTTPPSPPVGV